MFANLNGQVCCFNNVPNDILKHLNEMGIENSSLLNSYESCYFNVIFQDSRKSFDFSEKKVAFITGSNGCTRSDKKKYFNLERERLAHGQTPNKGVLYIFDENQKRESGGYDAVIVYWCKILINIENLPQRLK